MKFSIVTVCLNVLNGLQSTIESVRCQTFVEYEHLIIDGRSTDGTLDYLNTLNEIKYWSESDDGIFDAMNKGIKYAKGEWILFLNAGDTLVNKFVLEYCQRELLALTEVGVVYGNSIFLDTITDCYAPKVLEFGTIMACHQSMFFNNKLLRFNLVYKTQPFKFVCEYELLARLYKDKFVMQYIPQLISNYEDGGISTGLYWKVRIPRFYWLTKYFGWISIFKYITSNYISDLKVPYKCKDEIPAI